MFAVERDEVRRRCLIGERDEAFDRGRIQRLLGRRDEDTARPASSTSGTASAATSVGWSARTPASARVMRWPAAIARAGSADASSMAIDDPAKYAKRSPNAAMHVSTASCCSYMSTPSTAGAATRAACAISLRTASTDSRAAMARRRAASTNALSRARASRSASRSARAAARVRDATAVPVPPHASEPATSAISNSAASVTGMPGPVPAGELTPVHRRARHKAESVRT